MVRFFAGLDVGVSETAICVMNDDGTVVSESTVMTLPAALGPALGAALGQSGKSFTRIGMEACSLATWLAGGLSELGFAIEIIETFHASQVMKTKPNKTDRNDARSIADMMRVAYYRSVHVKSREGTEINALLTTRSLLMTKVLDVQNCVRSLLQQFGLKPKRVARKAYLDYCRTLAKTDPFLVDLVEPLLKCFIIAEEEFHKIDLKCRRLAGADGVCRRLMTVPGVGPLASLIFKASVDEPARFQRSRTVGAYFGLTPVTEQSGRKDRRGGISKAGNSAVRRALYQAAKAGLLPLTRANPLKAWALKIVERRGKRKGTIALARRLATIMHRIWINGTEFQAEKVALKLAPNAGS